MKPRDGRRLSSLVAAIFITGCGGGPVNLELTDDAKLAVERDTYNLSNVPTSLAFSADGSSLLVGTGIWNAKLRSWDCGTGKIRGEVSVEQKVRDLRLNNGSVVWSVAAAIDNSTVAFGGRFAKRTTFAIWDVSSNELIEVVGVPVPTSVATGLRRAEFFCGTAEGGVTSVDISTQRVTPVGEMRGEILRLFSLPTARLLFSVSDRLELAAWNVESRAKIDTIQVEDSAVTIDVTRDGHRIAIGDKKGQATIYEFDGSKFQLESRRECGGSVAGIAWSHDASLIAAVVEIVPKPGSAPKEESEGQTDGGAAQKRILRIWNAATWSEIPSGLVDEDIVGPVFSPIAPVLAVVTVACDPIVLDLQTGQIRRLDPVQKPIAAEPD